MACLALKKEKEDTTWRR